MPTRRSLLLLLLSSPLAALLILLASCSSRQESAAVSGRSAVPIATPVTTPGVEPIDERRHLDTIVAATGGVGSFHLFDATRGIWITTNRDELDHRYVPASTFKIYNSMVALETGVVADTTVILPWDGITREITSWNEPMPLPEAFRRSCVPCYQRIAATIGAERMRGWMERVPYGNSRIGDSITRFWLDGPLAISPREQIMLLRRIDSGSLPFSQRTTSTVRAMMAMERGDGYLIRGKTGWAQRTPEAHNLGWIVGWVERGEERYYFASLLRSDDREFPMIPKRLELLHGMLRSLKVIDG